MREALHEADGVGDEHRLAAGEPQPPGRGIEGGEEAVLDEHVGVGDPVQQRRLAGVGVPDERDGRDRAATATLALRGAVLGQAVEIALEPRDAREDPPAVDLELGLAGTAGTDESAACAATCTLLAELLALPAQAGESVAQLRELDLHHAFLAACVLGEDVEDQRDAIDDVDLEQALEVALLRGRELVVEDDEVDVERVGELLQLLGLAGTDVGRGVGRVAPLQHELDGLGARGVGEARELLERRLGGFDVARADARAHEQRALAQDAEIDLGRGEPPAAHARSPVRARRRRRTRARPARRGGWCRPARRRGRRRARAR